MNKQDESFLSSLSNVSDCGIKHKIFENDFFNKSGGNADLFEVGKK